MAQTLTGATIASTYKTLLKAGTQSGGSVALSSGSTTERLVFGEDDAADVRTAIYVSQDRVGIGEGTPEAELHISSTTADTPSLILDHVSSGLEGANILFRNKDTNSLLSDTTVLGEVIFQGYDNDSSYVTAASIRCKMDGAGGGAGDVPGELFFVTSNGSGDPALVRAMTISKDQKVGIGTATPDTMLDIEDTTTSSATQGGSLRLSSNDDAALGADHRLGVIEFAASENASNVLVGAKIQAVAYDLWTPTSTYDHATNLEFYTQSGTAGSDALTTPRMVIDRAGRVGINTTAPDAALHIKTTDTSAAGGLKLECVDVDGSNAAPEINLYRSSILDQDVEAASDHGRIGAINYYGQDSGGNSEAYVQIMGRIIDDTHDAEEGALYFYTQLASTNDIRMVIRGDKVGIGTVAPGNPLAVNRSGDGVIVDFESADAVEGTVSISGATCSYNPFFGAHYTELSDGTDQSSLLVGTVLDSTDVLVENKFIGGKRLPKCKVNTVADSSGVYGVYHCDVDDNDGIEAVAAVEAISAKDAVLDGDGNIIEEAVEAVEAVAAVEAVPGTIVGLNSGGLGAYFIRIHKDVDVSIGDLLVSNGDGTAKKQDDDIIRSKTIGKVTSTTKKETYDDGSYIVPCVLYCG